MFVYWIHLPEHRDVTIDGYIGIATNFEQRMFAHKSCAKTGKNQILYKAIRKHGWDNIIKEIIVISDENYCLEMEKKLRPKERMGWNIAIGGSEITGTHLKGIKQSEQHISNKSKALIGRVSGMKGKFHSKEAKEKCRIAHIGKPKSQKSKMLNAEIHKKKIMIDGIIYDSWTEASASTGIPMGSISYLLKKIPVKGKWANRNLSLVM